MSGHPDIETIPSSGGAMDTMNLGPVMPILPAGGGETGMKKTHFRRGKVSATELSPGKWRLRWTDPVTRKRGDVREDGDKKTIFRIMDHYNEAIYSRKGHLPGTRRVIPSIHDSIADSIRNSKQGRREREQNARYGGIFEQWLKTSYPAVRTFEDLKPFMIQEYMNGLEKDGYRVRGIKKNYSLETLKKRLKPIVAAWRYIKDNYPECGLRDLPRIKVRTGPSKMGDQLRHHEIKRLLELLKEDSPDIYPIMVLMALAGLRPSEVYSLRRQDIDLERGLLTVRSTESHDPKTQHSHRMIPICSEALQAVRGAMNTQRVIPASGEIFLRKDGSFWTKDSLCDRYNKEKRLRLAKVAGYPRIATATMYRLRASFRTMASRMGLPEHVIEKYFGHAPKREDITGRHYREIHLSELRQVAAAFEHWRDLPIEDEMGEDLGNSEEGGLRTC